MVRPQKLRRALAVLLTLFVAGAAMAAIVVAPATTISETASTRVLLSDAFTSDSSLNSTLWQVNGTVGYLFGSGECGPCESILLQPSFSSAGMEVAQANWKFEVGTIQSLRSFAPPFTLNAAVEGVVSNGHTFVFGIASTNASSGVEMTGNLNSTDCSSEGNCGNPNTCGTSANPAVPPNQCYYGIDVKTGSGGGKWTHAAKLYLTPNVDVVYSLQISVDASGSASFSISQGGQVLGQSTAQVGSGPFYVMIGQSEGAPVAKPGANQAYWESVSLTLPASTTSTSSTAPTAPSPFRINVDIWIAAILVIFGILLIVLFLFYRRRTLTVIVQDQQTNAPISGASVSADGPENLTGATENSGKAVFKNPKKGDYSIQASAKGYGASTPAVVSVKKSAELEVKLGRLPSNAGDVTVNVAPPGGRGPGEATLPPESGQKPAGTASVPHEQGPPLAQTLAGAVGPTVEGSASAQTGADSATTDELEGLGGERVRQIIKTFKMKGAISPETALTAKELGLSRLFVMIMKRRRGRTKVFMEVDGRYYLNQEALKDRE